MSGEQKIDGVAGGVDGPVQVGPPAVHSNVGLVHSPGPIGRLQFPAATLVQFGRVTLDPAPDRGMVSRQASFREEFLDITIGERKSEVPAHCTGDHRGFEVAPFEQRWS